MSDKPQTRIVAEVSKNWPEVERRIEKLLLRNTTASLREAGALAFGKYWP